MSPHVTIDMPELQTFVKVFARESREFEQALADLAKRFRDVRNNERVLKSRNKREGWYWAKLPKGLGRVRTHTKIYSLAWRKQSGAQVMFIRKRK